MTYDLQRNLLIPELFLLWFPLACDCWFSFLCIKCDLSIFIASFSHILVFSFYPSRLVLEIYFMTNALSS